MPFLLGGLAVLIIIAVFFLVVGGMALIAGMVVGHKLRQRELARGNE